MPSKNSFFKSIMWRLFFYFIAVIVLTAVIIVVSVISGPPEKMTGRQQELDARSEMINRIVTARLSQSQDAYSLRSTIIEYGIISGSMIQLLDTDGSVIAQSEMRGPGFSDFRGVELSPDEMVQLKSGTKVSGERFLSNDINTMLLHYSAEPVYKDNKMKGILVVVSPAGPPRPKRERLSLAFLQGLFGALVIAAITSLYLSWSFIQPLRKMKTAAEKASKGNFSERMNLKRDDELGALAESFDIMSEELKKNIESRLKLMGDISHELNTPLTALRVNLEAIQDRMLNIDDDQERERVIQMMLNQTKRLSILVDDSLELSKFEAGVIKMNFEEFEVIEPVQSVAEASEMVAASKGMKITWQAEDENLQAIGDPSRIQQVVQNLVNNAMQHNGEGVTIKISAVREGNRVVFAIEDNGIGIPQEELENIFRRFHKVDKSRARREAGSGLGLAIVKEIIEAHHTTIQVESEGPGKGSRFTFSLPMVKGVR